MLSTGNWALESQDLDGNESESERNKLLIPQNLREKKFNMAVDHKQAVELKARQVQLSNRQPS